MQSADLVFQAGAVMLVDDRRRHEDEQVALGPGVQMVLKEITENGHVAEQRHLGARLGDFILEQTADRQGIAALDQNVGIERAGIDDRAGSPLRRRIRRWIAHLVADLRFHLQGDEVVLVDRWGDDQRVAKLLVLESTEDGGGRLFVEVQLRHRLGPDDFDLRLQIIGGHDSRVGEEFRIRILIQEAQRSGHLRHGQDGELAGDQFAEIAQDIGVSRVTQSKIAERNVSACARAGTRVVGASRTKTSYPDSRCRPRRTS